MRVQGPGVPRYSNLGRVAVGIKTVASEQRHCGFLYRFDGDLRFLHLAWHHELRDEAPSDLAWGTLALDSENGQLLGVFLSRVAKQGKAIPYGLDAAGAVFDPDTGEFLPPPLGKGLTCATFITAILGSLGFRLIDLVGWEDRTDDQKFQSMIVETLKSTGAGEDHVEGAARDIGVARQRPEEVTGAATDTPWPVGFARAEDLGKEVLEDLAKLRL